MNYLVETTIVMDIIFYLSLYYLVTTRYTCINCSSMSIFINEIYFYNYLKLYIYREMLTSVSSQMKKLFLGNRMVYPLKLQKGTLFT